jgi:hypothetical protein
VRRAKLALALSLAGEGWAVGACVRAWHGKSGGRGAGIDFSARFA